jgi:hypothetical protein
MDSLAAAAEAGRLDADKYIEIFSGKEDVRGFRHVLREAGGDRWLTDRHHNALRKLGNGEFDVTTYVGTTMLFDLAE